MQMQSLMDCMQRIREFFEKEGAFLAAEQEFIHYFALPFVIEPSKHPSFQGLFEVILKYIDTTQVENCRVILNLKRHKWHENSLKCTKGSISLDYNVNLFFSSIPIIFHSEARAVNFHLGVCPKNLI